MNEKHETIDPALLKLCKILSDVTQTRDRFGKALWRIALLNLNSKELNCAPQIAMEALNRPDLEDEGSILDAVAQHGLKTNSY